MVTSPGFWSSLWTTLVYTVGATFLSILFGLTLTVVAASAFGAFGAFNAFNANAPAFAAPASMA